MGARDYIKAEVGLSTRVMLAWRQRLRETADKPVLEALDFQRLLEPQAEWVRFFLRRAISAGASMIRRRPHTDSLKLTEDVNTAYERLDEGLSAALWSEYQAGTVRKKDEAELDKIREFVSFKKGAAKKVMLVSALHSSRLAVYGFVLQAELEQVTAYKLTAVLDGRTSDFCRAIHGRVFEVKEAATMIRMVLAAKSDVELKAVQPWPKQDAASIAAFKKLSDAEVVAAGWHIPPYHPHCRTLCAATRSSEVVVSPVVDPEGAGKVKDENWSQMGIEASVSDKATWADYVGVGVKEWLQESNGVDASVLLKKKLGKHLTIKAEDALAVLLIKGVQNSAKVVVDWAESKIKIDALKANDLKFIKRVYKAQVGLLKASNLSRLEVRASSPASAVAHTKMGFLPTETSWDQFRTAARIEMEEGGSLEFLKAALNPAILQLLNNLLSNSSVKAFWALASMVFVVSGATLLAHLLASQSITLVLDREDSESMERWNESQ